MCIRNICNRKKKGKASESVDSISLQQQTLMPTIIDDKAPQYLSVKEIGDKLSYDNLVRNIALTGPYGSGKSSVLYTLQQKYTSFKYLQISLATLESYEIQENNNNKPKNEDFDQLNRLIEYSILQQLNRSLFHRFPCWI